MQSMQVQWRDYAPVQPGWPSVGWQNVHGDSAKTASHLLHALGHNIYDLPSNFTLRKKPPVYPLSNMSFLVRQTA
jgi:hypothetical protein